jgi:uncharacterized protein (TIGR00297 family)
MVLIGFLISLYIAYGAHRRGSLTQTGALWAVVVGTLVFGLGDGIAGLALVAFFLSSTALGKFRRGEKAEASESVIEKGDCRDGLQVLSNGGPAAVFCVLYALTGKTMYLVGGLASLAAANADTWATEIGLLSKTPPRHILTLEEVPAGTSGAISLTGTLGMVAGALFIALLTWLEPGQGSLLRTVLVTLGGIFGGWMDSVFGATLQEKRQCVKCGEATEQSRHVCGGATLVTEGIAGIDNDTVNALATTIGGTAATVAWYLLVGR